MPTSIVATETSNFFLRFDNNHCVFANAAIAATAAWSWSSPQRDFFQHYQCNAEIWRKTQIR